MKKLSVLILSCFLLLAAGCAEKETEQDGKLKVYTSFYAMYDFTRMMAEGSGAEVVNLVPAGVEPHDWEPTASDMAKLSEADLFVYNGDGMEAWTDKVLKTLEKGDVVIVEASKDIPKIEEGAQTDPHIWLDPENAGMQMAAIVNGLRQADPEQAELYLENYQQASEKIAQLHQEYQQASRQFTKKDILVSHGAYGYLCRTYGFNQLSLAGTAGESETTPGRMAELVKAAREQEIKYVFFEPQEGSKTAEALAQEIGAQTLVLDPFENDVDGIGKDYFTVMGENLENLKKALY